MAVERTIRLGDAEKVEEFISMFFDQINSMIEGEALEKFVQWDQERSIGNQKLNTISILLEGRSESALFLHYWDEFKSLKFFVQARLKDLHIKVGRKDLHISPEEDNVYIVLEV